MAKRWSTSEEIFEVLTPHADRGLGGPILHRDGDTPYMYVDEGHMTVIGGSGTGKSRRLIFPQVRTLIQNKESFFALDPKGELLKQCHIHAKRTHNVKVFNCLNPGSSDKWNPLQYAWDLWNKGEQSDAQKKVREFVKDFCGGYRSNDDFWRESLINLTTGMSLVLIQMPDKNLCNIGNIYNLLNEDRESILENDSQAGVVKGGKLQELVESLRDDDPAKKLLAGYLSAAMTTRSSVLTTVTNKLADWCASEEISNLTSGDDFDIANLDVDERPLAVFVVIPDGAKVYSEIAAMLISQLTRHFKELADKKYFARLPNRLNVILEELGSCGEFISELPSLMSAARSRNIRFTNVIQSTSQLDSLYGVNDAETIRSNTNVWVMFRNSNLNTLYEFSRRCGEREIKVGEMVRQQPLIEATQLGEMSLGQCLILINNGVKFVEQFPDYSELYECRDHEEDSLPKTKVFKKSKPLSLSDVKNHIMSTKKSVSNSSFYRNEDFFGGEFDE